VAQAVEHLLCKHEALSLTPVPPKKPPKPKQNENPKTIKQGCIECLVITECGQKRLAQQGPAPLESAEGSTLTFQQLFKDNSQNLIYFKRRNGPLCVGYYANYATIVLFSSIL
jgi:hypothetical protein